MARPSKVRSPKHGEQFEVYADRRVSAQQDSRFDDEEENKRDHEQGDDSGVELEKAKGVDSTIEHEDDEYDQTALHDLEETLLCLSANPLGQQTDDTDADADDERRESVMTSTSISSMPESSIFDGGARFSMHPPYTPPSLRPAFKHPESLRRMHGMVTPTGTEIGRGSPKRSVLHGRSSRTGTPRSGRKEASGRSATRRKDEGEGTRSDIDARNKEFPLVLLHLTLLPVSFRWSEQSMTEILPAETLRALHLLRSRVSDTILRRGILIPHPQNEYELLEERLLEALELEPERVTKCGHFRMSSTSSSSSIDSGMGSSLTSSSSHHEHYHCNTCHSHIKPSSPVLDTATGQKWSIKIYAANGLMRSSAWTAAWEEMERVDVEILPWIGEEAGKELDAAAEREREEEEEADPRIRGVEVLEVEEEEKEEEEEVFPPRQRQRRQIHHNHDHPPTAAAAAATDIPLATLLRNYLYLLLWKDKRNLLILLLTILTVWRSLAGGAGGLYPFEDERRAQMGGGSSSTAGVVEVPTCRYYSPASAAAAVDAAAAADDEEMWMIGRGGLGAKEVGAMRSRALGVSPSSSSSSSSVSEKVGASKHPLASISTRKTVASHSSPNSNAANALFGLGGGGDGMSMLDARAGVKEASVIVVDG